MAGRNCPSSRHATTANLVYNDKYMCVCVCVCMYVCIHTPTKNKNSQTDIPVAGFIIVSIIYQNYDKISVIQFFVDYSPVFVCV
jgi:hypothetical protein